MLFGQISEHFQASAIKVHHHIINKLFEKPRSTRFILSSSNRFDRGSKPGLNFREDDIFQPLHRVFVSLLLDPFEQKLRVWSKVVVPLVRKVVKLVLIKAG